MNDEINQLIEEFELFDDWEEKYSYIIELGKKLPKLDEAEKVESNKVNDCVSQVWLVIKQNHEKLYFYADSDAMIVKGLLAIVLRIYSGKTKDQINKINFEQVFNKLDLKNHLSPSRSNGLFSVIRKVQEISN
ncbi:SufE family protein [Candidatus Aquarickettsia rohweri]|uniref:SufE family protein n=1 Tax=Candidatus Aquarickettsia rohweri TaxID=2602574 RepID=A0A3S0FPJ9_9RICK|nr:SufE family protein [Candidatus Aquarickettsia rohweri]RST66952.1 SufE family protein [Candidatus Aquarickettsia rohweri]